MFEPSGHHPVILVVEDDAMVRDMLHDILALDGYDVIEAEDGATAMRTLSALRPALVTLDLNLPLLSGADVLQMIRRTAALDGLKVIIVSGERDIPTDIQALADAVVAKPLNVGALRSLVGRLVLPPLRQ